MENHYDRKYKSNSKAKHEGFILVWLIGFLPLFFTAFTLLYTTTTQIELKSVLHQTCRTELLKIQETAAHHIQSLMAVNKLVDIANWAQFLTALSTIILIPFPFLAPIVETIFLKTKSVREAIPLIQKAIITNLRVTLTNGLWQTQRKLQLIIKNYKNKTSALWLIERAQVIGIPPLSLAIEAESPRSGLSKYRLKNNFSHLQSLTLSWNYSTARHSLFHTLAGWNQSFSGQCSATLEQEEPWNAVLYADKFSLKPL